MFSIVSFTGPSGAGKTTVQKYLGVDSIVTYTSREPRKGEIDGVHYHFTTREKILDMKAKGYLLEYTEYGGNLYSSDLHSITEIIKNNKVGSIVVDVHGARELKRNFNEGVLLVGIFASKEECRKRIYNRSDYNLEKRLASYEQDVNGMLEVCDIVMINSEENWLKNKRMIDWIRKGLITGKS
jgi:guanylate kinase